VRIVGKQLCEDIWEASSWGYLGNSFVRTLGRQFHEDI